MEFSQKEIEQETERLLSKLRNVGWETPDCAILAPLTLEINTLKKQQDAVILSHSYQTPDIMYGIADFIGDSYGLSVMASKLPQKTIIFCSVLFMGETAKLLNPEKEVLVPIKAGCSLAESVTADDIKVLRKKYPRAAFVCYVNTTAEVKAECDVCCTSSNAVKIVEALPEQDIVFIPDELFGENLRQMTSKNIILYDGRCTVHEYFTPEMLVNIRKSFPDVMILAHPECDPSVIQHVDHVSGTEGMLRYIRESKDETFMLVTECGIADRIRVEIPDKHIVGMCNTCPYMKKIILRDVLRALKNPSEDQVIAIPENIARKAKKALDRMFEMENA